MKYCTLGFLLSIQLVCLSQFDTMSLVVQPPTNIFGHYDPLAINIGGTKKHTLTLTGDLYTGSNAFTVKFTNNFFNSGFITDAIKDAASEKLSDENSVGVDVSSSLFYTTRADRIFGKNSVFLLGVEYDYDQSAKFTSDLFHLVFYGNADMQNETAELAKSGFDLTNLVYYKIGLQKYYPGGTVAARFGVNASFVQGISGIHVDVNRGSLFTAEDGLYLDLDYDFTVHTSGDGAPSYTNIRGQGFGLDVYGGIEIPDAGWKINVSAVNIGVVNWSKNPVSITGDTAFTFDGIDINNLFGSKDEALSGDFDSLLAVLGVTKNEESFSQALPSRLDFAVTKFFGDREFFISAGAHYILNVPYTPLIFFETGKIWPEKNFMAAISAHAGGYGRYNVGIDVSKVFWKNYQLKIGSSSLLGLINPNHFTGAAGFFQVSAAF